MIELGVPRGAVRECIGELLRCPLTLERPVDTGTHLKFKCEDWQHARAVLGALTKLQTQGRADAEIVVALDGDCGTRRELNLNWAEVRDYRIWQKQASELAACREVGLTADQLLAAATP